ncbi:MAG TPA: DUF4349 domain-containing protein [Gaiellaceae bacterium]|nr:DUF4349 domain-containing protein [Gaiellaceae bacterium]
MSEPLLHEIRATKPAAPAALRERVRALAAQEPAREPFLARLEWRRLVLVAPATLAVALVAGTVIGLTRDDVGVGGRDQAVSSGATELQADAAGESAPPVSEALPQAGKAVVPPVGGRLQQYQAELRLRVDDVEALSNATRRSMQIARSLGGFVASVQYEAPDSGVGGAQLVLRVPTARVETAVLQLSSLGTILGQRVGIQDLQATADDLNDQIAAAEREVASLLRQLRAPNLTEDARAQLQIRLADARRQVDDLRSALRSTRTEGTLATIQLSLTTEEIPVGNGGDSRIDDVKDVLAWEAIALLYALVIAGPLVLLGVLVRLAFRLRRRRENARLLDQP